MLNFFDTFLNSITMYKVVLNGLSVIAVFAIFFGVTELLPYSGTELLLSLAILIVVSYSSNEAISRVLKAPTNSESAIITALILFFLVPPITTGQDAIVAGVTAFAATASKYVFAINKKHIFNPAAVGAVVVTALGIGGASWWVATPILLPATLVVGLLIVRKIRRFWLLTSFLIVAVISITISNQSFITSYSEFFQELLGSWPLLFFGTIMLTEPLTTPPTRRLQIMYGALVGLLMGLKFSVGPFYSSPESVLILGNIFSYLVSPKQKLFLQLKEKRYVSPTVLEFIFASSQKPKFTAGQYLEWTLPHESPDVRGNRRYFTIASSPTEDDLHLGVKIPPHASSFKNKLMNLKSGDHIVASQLAGDFVLPTDSQKKLVFIAGGIGVTPFRSMAQYMIDAQDKRDVILLYCSSEASDFPYQDVFEKAKPMGFKTTYVITREENKPKNWKGMCGHITAEVIQKTIPDFAERTFYLSGPNMMVHAYKDTLLAMNVPRNQIEEDYFPGF